MELYLKVRVACDGGKAERLQGLEHEGTWKVFGSDGGFYDPTDTTKTGISYVYFYSSTGSFVPTQVGVEEGPMRMRTEEASSGTTTWFSPIGE